MRHAQVWILLALVLSLLASACGNGEEGPPATSEAQLGDESTGPGPAGDIVYARTPSYLIRFDLARRTAEPRELQNPLALPDETAAVAGNRLVLASVSRNEDDEWIVTLEVLDGATGRKQDRIVLDPLSGVPPGPSDFFDIAMNSIRIWYVPQTQKLLVGIAISQTGTTSFRLDIIDVEDLVQRRSIELGEAEGRNGDIHVAMDVAGSVAVLLTGSPQSRLLVGPPDLSSLEVVDEEVADCSTVEAASTERSQARYFLCLGPRQEFAASMLVVEDAMDAQQYALPPRFPQNLQAGTADFGNRVFIGTANPSAPTVLAFDLTAGEIVAERGLESVFNSSWPQRVKRFIFGRPAFAITVVFKPIVASPDGSRVFFTNGRTLWCLRPDDLSIVGQVEMKEGGIQVLGMTADGAHVVAGAGRRIDIVSASQCQLEDTLRYDPREGPVQILVP